MGYGRKGGDPSFMCTFFFTRELLFQWICSQSIATTQRRLNNNKRVTPGLVLFFNDGLEWKRVGLLFLSMCVCVLLVCLHHADKDKTQHLKERHDMQTCQWRHTRRKRGPSLLRLRAFNNMGVAGTVTQDNNEPCMLTFLFPLGWFDEWEGRRNGVWQHKDEQ